MFKRCAVLFVLSFLGMSSFASDSTNVVIDSLRFELINTNIDTSKIDIYCALSDQYLEIDYEESITYSELALDLAIGVRDENRIIETKLRLAHIYLAYVLDYVQAMKFYDEVQELAQMRDDIDALLSVHRGKSYIYAANENFEVAKEENNKAMEYAEQLGEYPKISSLNAYMGDLYEMSGDTATAITYFEKVLEIEEENNFMESSNISMVVIAHYYYLIDDIDQSLKYYRIALKRFQRIKDQRWTSYTHSEMAKIYTYEGNFERAEMHAQEGLAIAQEFKLRKELGDNYSILAVIYDSLGNIEKSEEYLTAYIALQDSLVPIETAIDITEGEDEKPTLAKDEAPQIMRFVDAIIICMPFILLLIFMGMPSKQH